MPVYMITEVTVKDAALYGEYVRRVREIVERHGGRYLARGGKVTTLAGNWCPERIAVIQFESVAQITACFESEEYRNIALLREQSTESRAIVVEGC